MAVEINISTGVQELLADFSLSGYLSTITPLLIVILGILVYAFFIFKFYRFLSAKDILKLELHKHAKKFEGISKNFLHVVLYIIENIVLVPILIFVWFIVLAILLFLLSKNHSFETLMVTSLALVAAVRIYAFYNEDLAKDLAKLVPFTLLGVFLAENIQIFSLELPKNMLFMVVPFSGTLVYYLIFVAGVEIILRILYFSAFLVRR